MSNAAGRHLREWVLLSLLLLGFFGLAQKSDWFERADNGLYDSSVVWAGRAASPDILILAIDESSLARVGRWPWSRHRLAEAIEALTQAGSGPVLIDVILAEPQMTDPTADAHLAAAIAAHARVVLPVFMPSGTPAVRPLDTLAQSARLGHAQALVDNDGVTRRYLAQESDGTTLYEHLATVLMGLANERDVARLGSGAALLAARTPTDVGRLVPYAGPAGHFARLPLADLLEGRIPAERLRGRFILIGATATGLGDTVVTPLAGVNGAMPGVEFVANVLDAERMGLVRAALPGAWQSGIGSLVILAHLVSLLLLAPRWALLGTIVLVLSVLVLSVVLLVLSGWWWPPAAVVITLLLAYPLWSWRRLESSLATMTRETTRIAGLLQPGARRLDADVAPHFLDPVQTRIAAITQAVDAVADALVVDNDASQSAQYRDDMMRHLAHDLRSPLVSLRGLADQLRVGGSADHAAMIARVDACARRSLDLTEQFLLIGRAQAADHSRFGEVDLVQLLHSCADDLREDAQAAGVRVTRQCLLDLALVSGDERLLRRALMNLGWNAVRHGVPNGLVTLSLAQTVGGFLLATHDQGTGFAAPEFDTLSQRYARGATGGKGHGLGLALVQLVAQKHHAVVQITHPAQGGFQIGLLLAPLQDGTGATMAV